jgi:hypothetical protein
MGYQGLTKKKMRKKKRGGLRESVKKRESERDVFFFFIKILDWVAIVLPNVLSSTIAIQRWSFNIRQLL